MRVSKFTIMSVVVVQFMSYVKSEDYTPNGYIWKMEFRDYFAPASYIYLKHAKLHLN